MSNPLLILSGLPSGKRLQIAIEHGHRNREFSHLNIAIFHSHVKLPETKAVESAHPAETIPLYRAPATRNALGRLFGRLPTDLLHLRVVHHCWGAQQGTSRSNDVWMDQPVYH